MDDVISEIEALEHFREVKCYNCNEAFRIHVLQIHVQCSACGAEAKCRGFGGIGTEIQDVVDAVLKWAGSGEEFAAVMRRRDEILQNSADNE